MAVMKQFISNILVVLIQISGISLANAQISNPIAQPDQTCAQSTDPWETAYRFTDQSSKYSGQCIDSQRFRSIKNLKIENQNVSLNNYFHQGQYWQAEFSVAPENVEKAIFQIVRFPILGIVEAAHIQIRFLLKNPIYLRSQTTGQNGNSTDILVSFEASRPKGEGYNFALGVLPNFALAGRVLSAEQRSSEGKEAMEQYELDLDASERAELLTKALERSQAIGLSVSYNTLRPNCTTEIVDLIDLLPRFKGKFPHFLTVISADPVAQPSIDALAQRKVLKSRIQNYQDEAKGLQQVLSIPAKKALPILPQVQNHSWSLVVALPRMDRLSDVQRRIILNVREKIVHKSPLILQALGSAMMKESGQDSAQILTGVIKSIQAQIRDLLLENQKFLPSNGVSLAVYLVPYAVSNSTTTLEKWGVSAALPFAIINQEVDESIPRSRDLFYHIAEGSRKAADAGAIGKAPAYMAGAGLKVFISSRGSESFSQILVGLKDQERAFTMANSQVQFEQSVVTGNTQRSTRPMMLITHHQKTESALSPLVQIEFGPDGGLAGEMAGNAMGIFQIRKDLGGSCQSQTLSAPTLKGKLSTQALGKPLLDKIIQGKAVAFHIRGAQFNSANLQVSDMDVIVATWPMNCLSVANVNQQFAENANQMLNKFKGEMQNGVFIQKIISTVLKGI